MESGSAFGARVYGESGTLGPGQVTVWARETWGVESGIENGGERATKDVLLLLLLLALKVCERVSRKKTQMDCVGSSMSAIKSEEKLARVYDKALSNTLLNTSKALLVGIAFSAIAFRRKTWPIALSTGVGLGMSYSDCTQYCLLFNCLICFLVISRRSRRTE